ncbi:MAG TPA: DEAD/DEAH box helicase [Solirubrobacterales bacterium]|nr:DEAD/DEAH box helicase [Solirubrobacterales bacterium]
MSQSFADLGVSERIVSALAARQITEPFAVQRLVIADVLAGRDVLVQSPTGSGKTLAFGVPMADRVAGGEDGVAGAPDALILAPTRELAGQIVAELRAVAAARHLRIAAVYGGVGFGPQIKAARDSDIVVATPGRLEDLLQRGDLELDRVALLVLDEADRMLDMGFKPAVDRIVAQTPRDRQTLFFSATLEGATGKVARAYTRDPRRHVHAPKEQKRGRTSHRFVPVGSQSAKLPALIEELEEKGRGRTLVFVRTKRGADRLVKRLRSKRVTALAMHGDKSQSQREKALARFERGDVETLVATDVAARGIDVANITHVINFDAPEDRDAYVHRVGRTGRAGKDGAGVSFVLADQRRDMARIAGELGLGGEFDNGTGRRGKFRS